MLRAKIIDALYPPPPPDPESAEDKDNDPESAENKEPSASADENQKLLVDESKRLRVASMSMLEGIVFKLLVSTRQEASTVTWHGSVSTTQIVDMVSATLGTDPATSQQVLTLHPHAPVARRVEPWSSSARPPIRTPPHPHALVI